EAAGVEILRVEEGADGRLDLAAALRTLATRGLTRIFCEGGPRLAAALLAADLVDDAILLTAPRSLGAAGLPALDAPGAAALADVRRFVPLGAESWGADRAEVFTRIGRCSPA
ncbi:MAG: dihydrofolate reductase family protein, partial [Hyphomicrobiales bacterium]|nr:dihydrofolate reductase family protein [Hyphomicrobiales bacterium]